MSTHGPNRGRYDPEQPTRPQPAYREPIPPEEPYVDEPHYDTGPELIRRRQAIVYQKIANIVWFITFVIIALITLRVVLLLINANEENAFVAWVYRNSEFFVRPFMGITDDPTFNGIVFEVNSLIAMLIYILLIYGILQLVRVMLDLTMPSEP